MALWLGFPLFMLAGPLLMLLLWCGWTGVRGVLPTALATVGFLVAYGVTSLLLSDDVVTSHSYYWPWGMVGFYLILFLVAVPTIHRAFSALPVAERGASLKPRRIELFRGAFVWPYGAWAALTAWVVLAKGGNPVAWLGPILGLVGLLILKPCLKASVREPEILGGEEPERLAAQYAAFRRRRVCFMYWLNIALLLCVTGAWGLVADARGGWIGGMLGAAIGLIGCIFGTWADAQRYLLRRQLSGAAAPT